MKEPTDLIKRARELVKLNHSLPEIVHICEQEGILSSRTEHPFSIGSVRYWLNKYKIKIKNKRNKMKEPTDLIKRARELIDLECTINKITSVCKKEGIVHPRTGQPFSESSVRYWLDKYQIKKNPLLEGSRAKPAKMIERALELLDLQYTPAQIANICKQENIINSRTKRPFSESSVRYWLSKYKLPKYFINKSKLDENKEILTAFYTQSMQSMGMTPDQIERELKELL